MTIHIISLGAGVQSSTMALMAACGEITPMPECAVFADTQVEPQSVYQCLNWMKERGYPTPPRSACVFCPYMHDREWLRLKTEEPDDFQKAVEFERRMQVTKEAVGFTGEVRLHRSMKWIDEVNFNPNENQADMFGNECEGMCGV